MNERGYIPWGSESTKYSKHFCAQVGGDAGLPLPKEAEQQETIIVRMDDFPKVVQRNNYLLKVPNSEYCSEIKHFSKGFRNLLENARWGDL